MKSIQTKILLLILCSVLVSTAAIISVSVFNFEKMLEEDSTEIMQLLCKEKKQEINEKLLNIEQSVNTIYHFAIGQIDDIDELWQDEKKMGAYIQKVKEVSLNAAKNTDGAVSVYYRFSQDKENSEQGIFLVKENDGDFNDHELTDIKKYDKDDTEHVGWYYTPLERKESTWMSPYMNQNLGFEMISYIIPVYIEGETVGVIGMDIDVQLLHNSVNTVQVYDSGYAFLTEEDGTIISHKDYSKGVTESSLSDGMKKIRKKIQKAETGKEVVFYEWKGEKKRLTSERLDNGMIFSICVPEDEIQEPRHRMIAFSLLFIGIILVVAIVITVRVTRLMVRPLKQLTESAQKIANADLEVSIECNTKDEVGVLAKSFKQTVEQLRCYIEYINRLAYTDTLTKLQNKTAYEECIARLPKIAEAENKDFAVAVMDINNLKLMNDTYGHEKGDALIRDAANIIQKIWDSELLYRIGGDEFVAILLHETKEACENRVKAFNAEMKSFNEANPKYPMELQVAVGVAVFDKDSDKDFADVFRRADALMYEDKARKKD